MTRINLQDRKAIVTGGAKGIGRGIAERFLASGAAVCLWDADTTKVHQTANELDGSGEIMACVVDVTNPNLVETGIEKAVAQFGHIDILVNNAGISGPNETVWDYPIEAWKHVVDVNLLGVFYCCHAVVPQMLQHGYGRIVNIASIAGKEGNPNASAYSASKAGVMGLTKSLGKELAQHGILVNCVTPAVVKTDIFAQMTPEHVAYMLSRIPMGRFGQAEEVAAMVTWLASEECSFATGGVFDVSGGRATY